MLGYQKSSPAHCLHLQTAASNIFIRTVGVQRFVRWLMIFSVNVIRMSEVFQT